MPDVTPRSTEGEEQGFAPHTAWHRCFEQHVQSLYELLDDPLTFHVSLDALARALRAHVRLEERDVLPLYERRIAGVEPSAAPEQYVQDHAAILRQLDELGELSVQVAYQAFPENHLGYALAAFDDLLDHHDLREAKLYTALVDVLTEAERLELATCFEGAQDDVPPDREGLSSIVHGAFVTELGRAYRAFLLGEDVSLDLSEFQRTSEVCRRAALLAERCVSLSKRILTEGAELDLPHRLQLQRTVDRAWRSLISFAAIELHRARRPAEAS